MFNFRFAGFVFDYELYECRVVVVEAFCAYTHDKCRVTEIFWNGTLQQKRFCLGVIIGIQSFRDVLKVQVGNVFVFERDGLDAVSSDNDLRIIS